MEEVLIVVSLLETKVPTTLLSQVYQTNFLFDFAAKVKW